MATSKTKLSAAVLGLVLAGAPASVILDQFLNEKEGNSLTAYKDGGGSGQFAVAPQWWMVNR
jgi:lysozyme